MRSKILFLVFLGSLAGCDGASVGDGGPGEGGEPVADAEAEGALADGGEDGGDAGSRVGAALTFAHAESWLLADRLCDFDGDGTEDNAIAELGGVMANIYTEYMSARMTAALSVTNPWMVHVPWVEDATTLTDPDVAILYLAGEPTAELAQSPDGVPPEGPFYAGWRSLDGCGEPRLASESASFEEGTAVAQGGYVPLLGGMRGRSPGVTITIDPAAETAELVACAYVTISDAGSVSGVFDNVDVSGLEVFVGGGLAVGVPTVPGLEPDVDVDGDGLERFVIDDAGEIQECVDGDLTVIEGPDCWADPRMADAFSFAFRASLRRILFAGREPGWERAADEGCPAGSPERSLFESPAYDDVPCAALEERCEPLAPQPCCDPELACAGMVDGDYRCFPRGCAVPFCDYGDEEGLCVDRGGLDRCAPLWRRAPLDPGCEPGTTGCTTEYGVSEGTRCYEYAASGNRYCSETCEIPETGCDAGHHCTPLPFTAEGVCTRQISVE